MPEKIPSIQTAMSDLDRYERGRTLAVECYRSAIKDFAHYSVDVDDQVRTYRDYLRDLAEQVADGPPEKLSESRATLRGILRGIRDRTEKYLAELRDQFAATECALGEVMAALATGESDSDQRLQGALRILREVGSAPEVHASGSRLLAIANEIDESLAALRQQHQLTVSQLKAEIGVLHKRIDTMDVAARDGSAPGLRDRAQFEQYLRSRAGETYCVVAIKVRGIRLAHDRFSPEVALELAGAFIKRLTNLLQGPAVIGKWAEEQYVAAVALAKPDAIKLSRAAGDQLGGAYSCLQKGKLVRPPLQVGTGVIEINKADAPDEVLRRIATYLI